MHTTTNNVFDNMNDSEAGGRGVIALVQPMKGEVCAEYRECFITAEEDALHVSICLQLIIAPGGRHGTGTRVC